MNNDNKIEFLAYGFIISCTLLIFFLIGYCIYTEHTNPCVEKVYDGGVSCYNHGSYTNCYQTETCIKRKRDIE